MPLPKKIVVLMVIGAIIFSSSACGLGYIVSSSYYQLELLALREPLLKARLSGTLSRSELEALRRVEQARDYAARLGFEVSDIYTSVAREWKRELYNVSACDILSFSPKKWWFPIVGEVPYLGFFSEKEARDFSNELRQEGKWDVNQGRVGAYSTLGYFSDPILPGMLRWNSFALLDLVFHELTHATIWLPSSVSFNESFANFVAEKATLHFVRVRHGVDSTQLRIARGRYEDNRRFRAIMRGLYQELDKLFKRTDLERSEKLVEKKRLYASIKERVRNGAFFDPKRALKRVQIGVWNNARLMQFRRYNANHFYLESIFSEFQNDFPGFFFEIRRIVERAGDPEDALKNAAVLVSSGKQAHEKQ